MKVLLTISGLLLGLGQAIGQGGERERILTLIERGEHQDGMRVGVWEYYDHPRHLSLKIDYDQGKLLYVRPDTGFYVLEGDQWVKRKMAVPCRFNGSLTTLIDHYDHFVVPEELLSQQKFFSTWLTFRVGPDGATHPEVHDDPGYGVKEQILKLFELAPNSWITGVDESRKAATCLMAIRFDYCLTCDPTSNYPAKVLFTGVSPRQAGPRISNTPMISFSPDNSKLTVLPITVGLSTTMERTILVDLKTKEIRDLPYEHYGGVLWLSNDEILFMPKFYNRIPSVLAKLELSKNKLTFLSDSATLYHTLSPDRQKIAFLVPKNRQQTLYTLYTVDLITGNHKVLAELPFRSTPERWSPDGKHLIIHQVEGGFLKYLLLSEETGEFKPLPVLNANVIGWSADGQSILQLKNSQNEWKGSKEVESPAGYNGIVWVRTVSTTQTAPVTELLETNLSTNTSQTLYKKGKEIRMSYSTAKNVFLLLMDNDVYLKEVQKDSKPVKIIEKCMAAQWSPDGEYIAYVSKHDNQLHIYTVGTRRSEILTQQPPELKKK